MSVYRHFRIKDNNAPHMDTPTFQIQKVPNVLGEALTDNEAKTLLEKYQVPVVPELKAFTLEEAVNAAEEIGYPVVMKINAREIIHKTEAKGVHLHLRDSKQVASSFKEITNEIHLRHPDIHVQGVTVQKMLEEGVETLVGLYRDPVFGLVLVFGLGGIWVEVIQDVSMRVLPVTDDDIKEMIYEIKAYPVLAGARGKYLLDIDSIVKTIKCITQLGVDNPNLQELDINPLYILPEGRGIFVVDSLIIL